MTTDQPVIAKTDIKLTVPYEERSEAKALGAQWDKDKGTWYVPKGADTSKFQQYLPADGTLPALKQTVLAGVDFNNKDEGKAVGAEWKAATKEWVLPAGADSRAVPAEFFNQPQRTVEKTFEAFAAEKGLIIEGEAIADGQLHRVPVEGGKPRARDGAYVLYDDANGRSGFIQNYKTGEKSTFGEQSAERVLTPKNREELAQATAARNAEIKQTQDEMAGKA